MWLQNIVHQHSVASSLPGVFLITPGLPTIDELRKQLNLIDAGEIKAVNNGSRAARQDYLLTRKSSAGKAVAGALWNYTMEDREIWWKMPKKEILMAQMLNIPKDLKKSFSNLIDLIPVPYRYDEKVQRDILLFLKLKGEEFVRNKIEQSKEAFSERTEGSFVKVDEEK